MKLLATPQWRAYQAEVADALRPLGFATAIDAHVAGVRGSHDVDVTARITTAGVEQLWIIECKKWNRPVPKERVLTLISIVSDVGADRGLMFCERGFQAGAIRSASNSNITLTSLADFRQNVATEIATLQVRALEVRIEGLMDKFMSAWDVEDAAEQCRIRSRYCGPPDLLGRSTPITVMARLSQMREALVAARFDKWPTWYYALDDEMPISVKAWDGLIFVVDRTITTCERIYDHMMGAEHSLSDWRDLQPPELADLLGQIRDSGSRQ